MSKLLPDRWADADFFTADLIGASPKDDVHTMEHPLFTLAKNKDTTIRRYTHNGNELEIQPGLVGMPTIWDKDVVIFLVSQAIEGLNRGRTDANERVVHFRAADYFMATNRKGSGRDYETRGFRGVRSTESHSIRVVKAVIASESVDNIALLGVFVVEQIAAQCRPMSGRLRLRSAGSSSTSKGAVSPDVRAVKTRDRTRYPERTDKCRSPVRVATFRWHRRSIYACAPAVRVLHR